MQINKFSSRIYWITFFFVDFFSFLFVPQIQTTMLPPLSSLEREYIFHTASPPSSLSARRIALWQYWKCYSSWGRKMGEMRRNEFLIVFFPTLNTNVSSPYQLIHCWHCIENECEKRNKFKSQSKKRRKLQKKED